MNVLSSSNDNINKGCSKQELAYPSKYSVRTVRENVAELTERQRRKIQQKENKRAALEKKIARMNKDGNQNILTENSGDKENNHTKNLSNNSRKEKNKSIAKGLKARVMNPKDPESSLSDDDDDDNMIDEFEEEADNSGRHFQEVTQESKDLFSNIKSEGQVLKILSIRNMEEAPRGMCELQGECDSALVGFEVIGEIGQGAHGKVLKLRKDSEKDKVIKLYLKEDEKEFLVEASILANLRRITSGGIGISTFIKTRDFYGIIMLAGVGTLGDFRDFMREEEISLAENELLCMHMGLIRNYAAIRQLSVFHRDIKLGNVILHSKDLNLEIIDYSFAVYADSSRKYEGYVGTHGFIAPHIYSTDEKYGEKRLLEGDLFSIGITVLCMADLSFNLSQRGIQKRARRSLKKISDKKRLCRILRSLIFNCKDSTEKQAKSMFPNHNMGYFSGLSKYQNRFESYLEKKEYMNPSKRDGNQYDELGTKKWKEFEREQRVAAENFEIRNENFNAINCYELIMKDYLVSGDIKEVKPFYYEIFSEIFSSRSIDCPHLLYSTLGTYLYLANDYEGAKFMFKMGLKKCKEKFDTLILLNNYAFICNFKGSSAFQSTYTAYNLIKKSTENIAHFVQVWLQSFQWRKQRAVAILNENDPQRKYDVLLTLHQPILRVKADHIRTELLGQKLYSFFSLSDQNVISKTFENNEELIFITFLNFCQSKASFLASHLEISNKELLEKIKQFCWSLNQEYYSQISFKPNFGGLSIILEFHEILLGYEKYSCELKELYEEIYSFERCKKEIYKLIDQEAQEEFFKKFLASELLIVLIGFIAEFSGAATDNNLSKIGISHLQKKTSLLLKFTDTVEMSIRKKGMEWYPNINFPFNEFLHSNSFLSLQTEELKLLQKINMFLVEFKFKIHYNPSTNKSQCVLSFLSLCVSERLLEASEFPIIPETITDLESLRLYVKQEETFDKKGEILHEILATKSLINLELEFLQGIDKKRHFHNDSAKNAVEFVCSLKRLERLKIRISDGHLTAEGVCCFEKIGKELKNLKSLIIVFTSCPYIKNSSIRSLIGAIDTFSQLEHFTLELQICGSVSIEKVAQYKNEMKSHLKEKVKIIVQPIIDFS